MSWNHAFLIKHARLSFYSNKPFQFILAVQTVCCSALCDDLNDPVEMQLRDYFEILARCQKSVLLFLMLW